MGKGPSDGEIILENPAGPSVITGALIVEEVEAGGVWEISVPSTQFCCEPITSLKTEVYFLKK